MKNIKFELNADSWFWWLRSDFHYYNYSVGCVNGGGDLDVNLYDYSGGFAPVCII